jgi:hypothetical protein
MFIHLLPALCLMQSVGDRPANDIERDGIVGLWSAPMATRETVLPLAVQAGLQLGRWAMLTASYGEFPGPNIGASAWTLGARVYPTDSPLAPYVVAEWGELVQQRDDTGGRHDNYAFKTLGIGVERVWLHHFSLGTDLQVGPGRRDSGSYHDPASLLWVQCRLALGVRF